MLRPEEVEMLVCGNPELDMDALRKVTVYDGYTKNDSVIRLVTFVYFCKILFVRSIIIMQKILRQSGKPAALNQFLLERVLLPSLFNTASVVILRAKLPNSRWL